MRVYVFVTLLILTTILTALVESNFEVTFAISPSFTRQEFIDSQKDWLSNTNDSYVPDQSLSSLSPNMSSIEASSYLSDGRLLNTTLWLSSSLTEKPSSNLTNEPSEFIPKFLVYVDVDSNNRTGLTGADYSIGYGWGNSTEQWRYEILEYTQQGKEKVAIRQPSNFTSFVNPGNDTINISTDLGRLNFPNQYNIAFSTELSFPHEEPEAQIYDTTSWLPIPPPQFNISAVPNSLTLRQGERETIQFQINSTTNLQPIVDPNAENTTNDEIIVDIIPNQTRLPSYGRSVLEMDVTVSQNAEVNKIHTIPIYTDIRFPLERLNTEGLITSDTSFLTVTVLPKQTLSDYVVSVWNSFSGPAKDLVGLISTISGIGIGGGILNYFRKKRLKKVEEGNKIKEGDANS